MMSVTLILAPNWVPVPQAVAPMVSFLSWDNPGIAINISTPSKMRNLDTLELANIALSPYSCLCCFTHSWEGTRPAIPRSETHLSRNCSAYIGLRGKTALSGSDDKGQEMPLYRPQDEIASGQEEEAGRETQTIGIKDGAAGSSRFALARLFHRPSL